MSQSFVTVLGLTTLIITAALTSSPARAAMVPHSLSVGGQLLAADETPIHQANVDFTVEVLDASATCVLYRESHLAEDLSVTPGRFNLILGQGTSRVNNLDSSANLNGTVFLNTGTVPVANCAQPTVALNGGDGRQVRISYDLGAGAIAMSPNVPLVSSAYAVVADSVQGKSAADLIQVNNSGSTVLTQANEEYAFSAVNWPRLKALLDGTSTQYFESSPTSPVDFNGQRLVNVADPTAAQNAATKNYADTRLGGSPIDLTTVGPMTGNNNVLRWDATANKWVASAISTSATGTAGGDLSGSYPSPIIRDDAITARKIASANRGTNRLLISDASTGDGIGYGVCTLNQVYAWTAGGWACTNVASLSPVTSVAGYTGAVTLMASDIGGVKSAALLDYGTAAGQLAPLDGSARLPAVDGSQLTNVNAVQLQTRPVAATAPTSGQVLGWNGSTWLPVASSSGSVTSVTGGVGLNGGVITSTGTLSVDVGSAAGKIVQENASAQIAQTSGNATSPAYTFAGNTGTGLFSSGVNQLALSTGGTTAVTITPSGAVGIGANSPFGLLHVNSASGPAKVWVSAPDTDGREIYLAATTSGSNWSLSSPGLTTDLQIRRFDGTANSTPLDIQSNGNIGVGTTLPRAGFDIATTGTIASALIVPRDTTAMRPTVAVNGMLRYNSATNVMEGYINGAWATLSAGSSAGSVMSVATGTGLLGGTITTNGTLSVDVGTAANQVVQENVNAQIAQASGSVANPSYSFVAAPDTGMFSPGAGQLTLASSGTARVSILANGNVGVGSVLTAPTALLYVVNSGAINGSLSPASGDLFVAQNTGGPGNSANAYITSGNSSSSSLYLGGASVPTAAKIRYAAVNKTMTLSANNIDAFTINQFGNVGVGTTSANAGLDVATTGTIASALIVPRDTTAMRPTVAVNGMIRYNSATSKFEAYENAAWTNVIGGGSSSAPLSGLTAATSTNSIDNLNFAQTWNWSSADTPTALTVNANALTSGGLLSLRTSSTSLSSTSGLLNVANVGTATSGVVARVQSNSTAGSGLTVLANGNVGMGSATPSGRLEIGGNYVQAPATSAGAGLNMPSANFTDNATVASGTTPVFNSNYIGAPTLGATNSGVTTSIASTFTIQGPPIIGTNQTMTRAAALYVPGNVSYANTTYGLLVGTSGASGSGPTYAAGFNGNVGIGGTAANQLSNLPVLAVGQPQFFSPLSTLGAQFSAMDGRIIDNVTATSGAASYAVVNAFNQPGVSASNAAVVTNLAANLYLAGAPQGGGNETLTNSTNLYLAAGGALSNTVNGYGLQVVAPSGAQKNYAATFTGGSVGVGTTFPAAGLDVATTGTIASAIIVPRDTAAMRPTTAVNGMIRYGIDTGRFEFYQAGAWQNMLTSSGTASSVALSGIAAAGVASSIDSLNFAQSWNWSTATTQTPLSLTANALTTGGVLSLSSSSTGLNSTNGLLNVANTSTSTSGTVARIQSNATAGSGLTVLANGNVGLGTAAPARALDINGDVIARYSIFGASNNFITMQNNQIDPGGLAVGATDSVNINVDIDNSGVGAFAVRQGSANPAAGTNLFYVANSGRIGVLTSAPQAGLDVATTGTIASAILVPRDSTAMRPTVAVNGMIRYNTATSKFEAYENAAWTNIIGGAQPGFPLLANPLGSAAAPAYSFSGNANTGMYSPGANQLALATNGTAALNVNASGNIGIGTVAGAGRVSINDPGSGGTYPLMLSANPGLGVSAYVNLAIDNTASGNYKQAIEFRNNGTPKYSIGIDYQGNGSNNLSFYDSTQGAFRLFISPNGNVGLGTVTPQAGLDVALTGTIASALIVPRDTTAMRPTVAVNGMIRYNTATSKFEAFESGAWTNMTASGSGAGDFKADGSVAMTGPLRAASGADTAPSLTFSANTNTGFYSYAGTSIGVSTGGVGRAIFSGNYLGSLTTGGGFIQFGAGSLTAPTFSFVGNTNSGLYGPSNNNLALVTNSVDRLHVDQLGNVGINSTTPQAGLDVATTGTISSAIIVPRDTTAMRPTAAVNGMLRYNSTLNVMEAFINNAWQTLASQTSGGAGFLPLGGGTMTGAIVHANGTVGAPSLSFANDVTTGIYSSGAGVLNLATAGVNRVSVLANGNVGIGSSSPGNPLTVLQDLGVTNGYRTLASLTRLNGNGTGVSLGYMANGSTDLNGYVSSAGFNQDLALATTNGVGLPAERMRLAASGNVGIGTNTPAAGLDVALTGSIASAIIVPRDTTTNRPTAAVNGMLRYNSATSKFEAYENAAWTNVIGGAQPGFPLLANPLGSAAAPAYSFSGNANTGMYSPGANQVALSTSGTAALTVAANGYVGIGTTAPSAALTVSSGSNFLKVTPAWLSGVGTWIDLDTNGPSGIGTGGPGNNPWVAYTASGGQWLTGAATGDIVYRNASGKRILMGIDNGLGSASPTLTVTSNALGIGTISPGRNVHLSSNGGTGTAIKIESTATGGGAFSLFSTNNTSTLGGGRFAVNDDLASAARFVIDGTGNVGVGTAAPQAGLDVATTGTIASALIVPRDTTAMRPTAAVNGMLRYNTATSKFEAYENAAWTNIIGGAQPGFPLIANPVGTAAAPAYSFSGSATTGMFSPAVNQMAFSANGATAATIASNGFVGIGTTTPLTPLHVSMGGGLGVSFSSIDGLIVSKTSGAGDNANMYLLGGTGLSGASALFFGNGSTKFLGAVSYSVIGQAMTFSTNQTGRMIIDGSGNVGIGTNTPAAGLDVALTGTIASALVVPRDTTAMRPTNAVNGMIRYNTATAKFEAYENAAWTNIIGNVAGSFPLLANPIGTAAAPAYSFSGSANTGMYSSGANQVAFSANGTAAMTITATGAIGIGTATPSTLVEISGAQPDLQLGIGNTATGGHRFTINSTSNGSGLNGGLLAFSDRTTSKNLLALNGNTTTISAAAGANIGWTYDNANALSANDTGLGRAGVGLVEVNNGFAGNLRDLRLRALNPNKESVGIGTTTPAAGLDVAMTGTIGSAIIVPRDTVANRPTAAVNGMIRYSTDTAKFEAYENGAWTNIIGNFANSFPLLANPIGTAAAPAYSFSGNANTGMYSPGANQLALVTNGAAALSILANGNVGIGTASPTQPLEIYNPNAATLKLTMPTNYLFIGTSTSSAATFPFGLANDGNFKSYTALNIGVDSAAPLRFATANTERLRIDATGKVGVGTTTPGAGLDIATTGTTASAIIVPRDTTAMRPTVAVNGMIRYNTATSKFEAFENNAWSNLIGGAQPGFPLLANPIGSAAAPAYSFSGNANTGVYSPGANQIALSTNGTAALSVLASGSVGIGTTAPNSALQIVAPASADIATFSFPGGFSQFDQYGSLKMNSGILLVNYDGNVSAGAVTTYNGTLYITSDGGGGGTNDNIVLKPNGTGKVGINTTTPTEKLHVVGNLRVQGSTDCTLGNGAGGTNCTSDLRLKENVSEIEDPVNKVLALRGVEFDWNQRSPSPGRHDIGVVAQDVEKVFPTAVVEDADTHYKKVDYAVLVAPLIQAFKELHRSVRELFSAQATQTAEIERLKTNLSVKDREIASLREKSEVDRRELERKNAELRARMDRLERILDQGSVAGTVSESAAASPLHPLTHVDTYTHD